MVGGPGVAEHGAEPVHLVVEHEVLDVGEGGGAVGVRLVLQVDETTLVLLGELGVVVPRVRGIVVILQGRHHGIGPLVQGHQGRKAADGLHRDGAVVADLHLARRAFLGGDEHDAAGRAGTVDGGRRVLQEGHRGDIVGVQQAEGVDAVIGDTVDDYEGFGVVGGDGAAERHRPALVARGGGGAGDDHAGNLALKGLHRAGERSLFLEHLFLDHGDGTGEGFLLHGAITHDDDFIQKFVVLFEGDDHAGSEDGVDILVANDGHGDGRTGRSPEGEPAVEVGGDSVRRPVHDDGGADDRLPRRVDDLTAHGLGEGLRSEKQGRAHGGEPEDVLESVGHFHKDVWLFGLIVRIRGWCCKGRELFIGTIVWM